MSPVPGWTNPIVVPAGQWQHGIDPSTLRPARTDLVRSRLEFQRRLLRAGIARATPILVTTEGVIFDGHHAVRVATEEHRSVDVLVTPGSVAARGTSILSLPVR